MRYPYSAVLVAAAMLLPSMLPAQQTITGQAAFADWNQQQPGVRRKITLADLAEPKPDEAVNNTPHVIPRPAGAWPIAPDGFKVTLYAGGDSAPMQRADNKQVVALNRGRHPRVYSEATTSDSISVLRDTMSEVVLCSLIGTEEQDETRRNSATTASD